MKITPEILEAVNRACDYYGNQLSFAKKMNIAHSTVLFWKTGKTKSISGKLWISKVRSALKQFMSESSEAETKTPPGGIQENHRVPQASAADFQNFDPSLESPVTFAGRSKETACFGTVCNDSYCSVRLDDSMGEDSFLNGCSLLLASGEYAKSGDAVLVKLIPSQQIIFGHYFREENQVKIVPIHPKQKKSYQWDLDANASHVFWMYPVLEMNMMLWNIPE